jgi:hypothetical protein
MTVDCAIGYKFYRHQLTAVTGWGHHVRTPRFCFCSVSVTKVDLGLPVGIVPFVGFIHFQARLGTHFQSCFDIRGVLLSYITHQLFINAALSASDVYSIALYAFSPVACRPNFRRRLFLDPHRLPHRPHRCLCSSLWSPPRHPDRPKCLPPGHFSLLCNASAYLVVLHRRRGSAATEGIGKSRTSQADHRGR